MQFHKPLELLEALKKALLTKEAQLLVPNPSFYELAAAWLPNTCLITDHGHYVSISKFNNNHSTTTTTTTTAI
jgi:hypothetical protein